MEIDNPGAGDTDGRSVSAAQAQTPTTVGRLRHWLSKRGLAKPPDAQSPTALDAPVESARSPVGRLNREGEETKLWFRTDRVFYQSGGWYIGTREGIDVGPYEDADTARRDEKRLIELLLESAGSGPQGQMQTIHQFMSRPRTRNPR